jgi:hypothetical protein
LRKFEKRRSLVLIDVGAVEWLGWGTEISRRDRLLFIHQDQTELAYSSLSHKL